MTDEHSNDNDVGSLRAHERQPDAHGRAAMLLVESLIHGLIARSVIRVADAVEIIEVATDVEIETVVHLGDQSESSRKTLSLLDAISTSLKFDINENQEPDGK